MWQTAYIYCNCDGRVHPSRRKRDSEYSYDRLVDGLVEIFFTLVKGGFKANAVLWCGSDSLYLGQEMSVKYASECTPEFFKKHVTRALKEGDKDTLAFEVIEGDGSEQFSIIQEKGN